MGVGFTEAMEGVEKDMESTLPTDFKLHMNSVVTGGEASGIIFVFYCRCKPNGLQCL